ncbi:hypothetical protein SAMN06266982_102280 [Propioniciclava tarda]|nr:hypothetical protein SAMN06266982_102280 [Propioniciclava tarda]
MSRGFTQATAPAVGRSRRPVGTTDNYVPPGWPSAVRPARSPDWERTASAFLLDACPPDTRGYAVLRKHPIVLAMFALRCVDAQLAACREALSACRADLDDFVPADAIADASQAWLELEAGLVRQRREVALVDEALRGGVFIRRL